MQFKISEFKQSHNNFINLLLSTLMNSARKITTTIILDSFGTLKNLQKITNNYLHFNPYLDQTKTHALYPLISYNRMVKRDI